MDTRTIGFILIGIACVVGYINSAWSGSGMGRQQHGKGKSDNTSHGAKRGTATKNVKSSWKLKSPEKPKQNKDTAGEAKSNDSPPPKE